MSISGNNHSSGNSGSRTSIFEAFHTPSFGDDHFDVQQPIVIQPIRTYTRQPVIAAQGVLTVNSQTGSSSSLQSLGREDESRTMEQEIFDEDEESSGENAETTLWMSCSPGRDSTDDEEEEEEEGVAPSQEDEEEDEGEGVEAESSDDGLPLSKLAGKRFLEKGLKPPSVNKRNKPPKPLRLRKDKKGPKKPLSAYAFFYRDTQMAIKSQNPQATFGEISKIVASMWDRLDGELKEDYNKRAEENKKEYIKQLAEYCALNKDKIQSSAKSKQKKPKKSSSKPKRKPLGSDSPSESQDRVNEESDARDETDNVEMSRRSSDSSDRMMSPRQDEKQEKPRPICNYTKCQNPAIDDPRWETNYCGSECVILHCKDVFNAWVANRKTAYCET